MRAIRGKELFPVQTVEHVNPIIQDKDIVKDIIAQKNFRQEKYLEMVKKFMDQTCEYSFMNMIPHQTIKDAWSQFLRDNNDQIKHLNIAWGLTPADISKLDPRYTYKRVHICRSCNQKQFSKCCEDYNPKTKSSHNYMIHMALKYSQ